MFTFISKNSSKQNLFITTLCYYDLWSSVCYYVNSSWLNKNLLFVLFYLRIDIRIQLLFFRFNFE